MRILVIEVILSPSGDLRTQSGEWTVSAVHDQRMVGEQTFCFLNETHDVATPVDWNNREQSKLWLYNLHYFDDLTAVDADQRVELHKALIHRWIVESPPGKGNGWEAYSGAFYLSPEERKQILIDRARDHFKQYFEDGIYHRNRKLGLFVSGGGISGKKLIEEMETGD